MYHPYFRGKQFELITIRELAPLLANSGFVPIVEPVREGLNGLRRALEAVCSAGGRIIVVVNPNYGDHKVDGASISEFLSDEYGESENVLAGILLSSDMTVEDVVECYAAHEAHNPVLVHAGFTIPKALAAKMADRLENLSHVFLEDHAKTLYRRHFESGNGILIRDGFRKVRNADYPDVEEFSDLHVTFDQLGMDGFGDFLVVGDVYSEGGGPAYAVAIHLTFIDPDNDDVMYIHHFVSDTKDTPADPAGKFAQALSKLIEKLDSGTSHILDTSAVREFRVLHEKGHFPGLGYIKKLSMKHHVETLAHYLG